MTLIDDDQTEIGNRRKDSAAGSHRQFDFSFAESFMVNGTLSIREHRMQNRNGTEALSKSLNRLRSQGDLWEQNEDPFASSQCGLCGTDVDLSLSTACDSMKQEGLIFFEEDLFSDTSDGGLLLVIRLEGSRLIPGNRIGKGLPGYTEFRRQTFKDLDSPLFRQSFDGAVADPAIFDESSKRNRFGVLLQKLENPIAGVGTTTLFVGECPFETPDPAHLANLSFPNRFGKCSLDGFTDSADVVVRSPIEEGQQFLGKGGSILDDRMDFSQFGMHRVVCDLDDPAVATTGTKGDKDRGSGDNLPQHFVRDPIIEGLMDRNRNGDPGDILQSSPRFWPNLKGKSPCDPSQ